MLGILAAVLLAAAPTQDTVHTADGGRYVGTVIEETAQGVAIQLPDGTTRRLDRAQVARIEYADGSVSTPNAPPPRPAPQPAPQPPPSYAPPPPAYRPPPPPTYRPAPPPQQAPPRAAGIDPISPVYGSLGLGGLFLGGDAEDGLPMDRRFDAQLDVWLEGGVRLSRHVGLGVYADIGVGNPAPEVRPFCDTPTTSCTATTGRVGLLLRHTFAPSAPSTPWIAVGTGAEFGSVSANDDGGGGSSELFNYAGWEMLRFMAGVDLRTNPVFGFGLYGGLSLGKYSRYEDADGRIDLPSESLHTMAEAGIRITLFP